MKIKPIIVVSGEPFSIFSEIFFKTLETKKIRSPIILIASEKLIYKQMKRLKYNFNINIINKNNIIKKINNNDINLINVDFKFKNTFEKISDNSNKYIKDCFDEGLDFIKKNQCLGLVNGPISKKNFLKQKFLGITEYLANKSSKVDVAMLIYNKKISVSPITTHLPLKKVHKNISKKKIINQIMLIIKFYKKHLSKNPRIGVTGLNPHCESNYINSEEKLIIEPSIKYLKKKKYNVNGPFPADTIFLDANIKKYDVIIGMYHDQVLTPIKSKFGFDAINITLGLPFIRISPDHGTNAKMVGKNTSDPRSLIQALTFLDE
mgnify:CR=1 FL=1